MEVELFFRTFPPCSTTLCVLLVKKPCIFWVGRKNIQNVCLFFRQKAPRLRVRKDARFLPLDPRSLKTNRRKGRITWFRNEAAFTHWWDRKKELGQTRAGGETRAGDKPPRDPAIPSRPHRPLTEPPLPRRARAPPAAAPPRPAARAGPSPQEPGEPPHPAPLPAPLPGLPLAAPGGMEVPP